MDARAGHLTDLDPARHVVPGRRGWRPSAHGAALSARAKPADGAHVDATDADAGHFRTLLAVIGLVALTVSLLLGHAVFQQQRLDHAVTSAALATLAFAILFGRRYVASANLPRAAVLASLAILVLVVALAVGSTFRPTLALTTLVAVLIAMPYVDRSTLRRLAMIAFGVGVLIGLLHGAAAINDPGAGPSEAPLRFAGVSLNMAIALFAIIHLSGRLSAAVQRYRDLFQRVPIGMYRTTPDGRFLDANGAFAAMFGYRPDELAQVSAAELYADPADRLDFQAAVGRAGVIRSIEYRARRPDGRVFWVRDSALLVRDPSGRPLHYEGIVEDVTERRHHELKLVQRASHDALTGLANRTVLIELLEQALADASADRPVALLFVDLDGFKRVNDRFGHAAGDRLLVEAGHRLRVATRETDTICRFGGDEFAALLEVPTGRDAALAVAKRISSAFEQPFVLDDETIELGVSVGVAIAERPEGSAELISRADEAMYQAKAGVKVATVDG